MIRHLITSSIRDDRSASAAALIGSFDPGAAARGDNQRHQSVSLSVRSSIAPGARRCSEREPQLTERRVCGSRTLDRIPEDVTEQPQVGPPAEVKRERREAAGDSEPQVIQVRHV